MEAVRPYGRSTHHAFVNDRLDIWPTFLTSESSKKWKGYYDIHILCTKGGFVVRDAGVVLVWPPHRHRGHPFPLAIDICIHSIFEFLTAGLNFLPNRQGIHAHSVAGVRWQGLVPEKDTGATLSLPQPHVFSSFSSFPSPPLSWLDITSLFLASF